MVEEKEDGSYYQLQGKRKVLRFQVIEQAKKYAQSDIKTVSTAATAQSV